MKRAFTLLAITCLLLNSQNSFAKIWRVNNNAGVAADFTSLQAAHDGAATGDTIHVEGSPYGYGNCNFSKKLIVLGAGYFLDENIDFQALQQSSKIGTCYMYNGSQGSVLMGMEFANTGINVYTDDIIIRRNKFNGIAANIEDYYIGYIAVYSHNENGNIPANNVIISQNYAVRISINNPSTGILITNNLIGEQGWTGDATTGHALVANANAIILVQNNIFRRGKVTAYNSNFTNNVMVFGQFEGTGNLYSNNIGNDTQFGTANGNKSSVAMSTVFVGKGTGITTEGQWKLKAGSPALNGGYGSTAQNPIDCGMYSGQSPYVLGGMPPMPAVYSFEVQPIGSNTDPIDVKVKVRSAGN